MIKNKMGTFVNLHLAQGKVPKLSKIHKGRSRQFWQYPNTSSFSSSRGFPNISCFLSLCVPSQKNIHAMYLRFSRLEEIV